MVQDTTSQDVTDQQTWRYISLALLLGFIFFNFWESLEIALQTPIGATVQALPLFVSTTVFGIISFYLLQWDFKLGYGLTVLTGLAGIGTLALLVTGLYGSAKPGTPMLGVVVYLVIAGLLVITTYLAWRDRSA